jgi:hypothetical protein
LLKLQQAAERQKQYTDKNMVRVHNDGVLVTHDKPGRPSLLIQVPQLNQMILNIAEVSPTLKQAIDEDDR